MANLSCVIDTRHVDSSFAQAEITGFGWQKMILSDWVIVVPELNSYGFDL